MELWCHLFQGGDASSHDAWLSMHLAVDSHELLRPARKRRGDFAQKLVFHSGHADMDVAVATDC